MRGANPNITIAIAVVGVAAAVTIPLLREETQTNPAPPAPAAADEAAPLAGAPSPGAPLASAPGPPPRGASEPRSPARPPLAAGEDRTGLVVGPEKRPVSGAEVLGASSDGSPGERLALSDEQGRFPWPSPPRLLVIRAEGFALRIVPPGVGPIVRLQAARTLEGAVTARETGAPLAGARIEGLGEDWRDVVTAGDDGVFLIHAPPGPVSLLVSAPGRISRLVQEADLPRVALETGRGVSGRLVTPTGAAPGPSEVWVLGANQLTRPHAAASRPDGSFEVAAGLQRGEAFAVLAFAGDLAASVDPAWKEPSPLPLEVQLLPRGTVRLQGVPPELTPRLSPRSCPIEVPLGAAAPERDGETITYAGLPAGTYQVELGGIPSGSPVRLAPGLEVRIAWESVAPVSVPDQRTSELRVRVVNAEGDPQVNVAVTASASARDARGLTDTSGWTSLEVPEGALTLSAHGPGKVLVEPVLRDGDDRADVTLVLTESAVLEGQVFPAERAELQLLDLEGTELRADHSDDAGRFRLEGLPAGRYQLLVATEHKTPLRVEVTLPLQRALHVHLTEDYGKCGHEH